MDEVVGESEGEVKQMTVLKYRLTWLLIPIGGYTGLWLLGSIAFLVYFRIFNISMELKYVDMIRKIPAPLAIFTVPVCSFISFFTTSKIVLAKFERPVGEKLALRVALLSLLFTICLDIVITVIIQRMNILLFPVNVMYLLAWGSIVPGVLLAGNRKSFQRKVHHGK